ncbi:ScbR family autoregulator-binding transcription factor [Streptomyces sp. NPDC057638]|uniref:ScbR family autoregulator-binding transcription factor n=1 Tax=Streptomyces sp. NPDC057638 TaxID=3346190 RepID=UPI00369AEC58
MAKQDRAIRTRRAILEAAANVFQKQGYQGATITEILREAGVTKGALYFHFQSKEELAQGVIEAQEPQPVPDQPLKLQELIDSGLMLSYRLRTNLLARAGVRLSMDQQAHSLDRRAPFIRWQESVLSTLCAAKENGELLPHVVPAETADVLVGAFAGIQVMSQTLSDYEDLEGRCVTMQRHILAGITVPSVLNALDMSMERSGRLAVATEEVEAGEAVS